MEKLELTLENVEKIKNESNNELVKRVCRYIISNWEYYDDKKDIFLSIINGGCKSGACCDLIYWEQTKRFYDTYKREINEMLSNLLFDCEYKSPADLFGDKWDKMDPLALEEDNQNLLAWFGFEETLINIAIKFGIE